MKRKDKNGISEILLQNANLNVFASAQIIMPGPLYFSILTQKVSSRQALAMHPNQIKTKPNNTENKQLIFITKNVTRLGNKHYANAALLIYRE